METKQPDKRYSGKGFVPSLTELPIAPAPKLLEQVRARLRVKHYSLRTEAAYLGWIRRFILFHHKKHPRSENMDRHVCAHALRRELHFLRSAKPV
jgi:Phage integrase, N-terminal SAM-like domain